MTDSRQQPVSLTRWWRRFGLPLLGKEIAELAVRKRMYVERVAVGAAMYLGAYLMFADLLPSRSQSALGLLGRGREMFDRLVLLQFGAVYLFMPVLMAGTIAGEKERNTLVTLFVTRLSPATILLEKLLSRLIVMGTYLLLSMPVVALTYGLGGVGQSELWLTYWMLALTCMQVGVLGLWSSTYCHTTVGALAMTYAVGICVIGLCCFNNPLAAVRWADREIATNSSLELATIGHSFIGITVTAAFFFAALATLWDRAFATPRNLLLEFFRGLDRFFKKLNAGFGGIELVRDDVALPEAHPVSWRETRKKSLGTVRYLFRILVAIEIPLLAVLTWTIDSDIMHRRSVDDGMFLFLWPVSVLLVAVHASSLIAGERTKQTLDVLLASPMPGREVVRQKFHSVGRLILVLCVPFWTIYGLEWRTMDFGVQWPNAPTALNVICGVVAPVVCLSLAGWIAMWCGLRFHRQVRAGFVSLVLVTGWALVPWVLFNEVWFGFGTSGTRPWLTLLSPAGIVFLERSTSLASLPGRGWPIFAGNFLGYVACLWWIRRQCLNNADRYLGRC